MAAIYAHFLCEAGCAARIAEGDFSVVPQRNHSGHRFELAGVFLKTDSRKELFVSIDGQQGRDESIAHIRQQKDVPGEHLIEYVNLNGGSIPLATILDDLASDTRARPIIAQVWTHCNALAMQFIMEAETSAPTHPTTRCRL